MAKRREREKEADKKPCFYTSSRPTYGPIGLNWFGNAKQYSQQGLFFELKKS
jgi:hypothetical protein